MVVSVSLMVLYQLQTQSASRTVAVSAIFVTASVRIMPALLRLQQNMVGIRKTFSMAKGAFDLIDEIHQNKEEHDMKIAQLAGEFTPRIEIKNVTFSYKNSEKKVFENLNINIYAGSTVGIVGKSGIGKSTLVDLILGLLKPEKGTIEISRVDPMMAIRVWPGQISYLPQKTFLLPGTVRKNLALGYEEGSFSDSQYLDALSVVYLAKELKSDTGLLDFVLTEDATNISGGQRQRIGIARAILGSPKLLILDEATSSLDVTTEEIVMLSLKKLLPDATLVFITHKKSTLTFCDSVIDLNQQKEIPIVK
jgi:ABC-type bacteriocin/lantibiotic exporter with double-glycine peptidase domain